MRLLSIIIAFFALPILVTFAQEPEAVDAPTLRVAYDADPVSLDPHEQLSGGTLQLCHLAFDPLVRWNADFEIEPRLATRWETIDDTTLRFHLRKGVTFHSGNPFTAADVQWTFNRLKKSGDFKGLFAPFTECKIIDDHTIDLVTAKPYPIALNLATYIFPMDRLFYTGEDENGKPKDQITKHGASFASTHLSGTGAFRVTGREQGLRLELTRFADHWDPNTGNLGQLTLTPIKEDATRVAALLAGDVDFIAPVPPNDLERLGGDPKVTLVTMPGTRIIMWQLNQSRREELRDPRVRQAIDLAINNPLIAEKLMKGMATPAGQLSPAGYSGHDPDLKPRYDLKKARALMVEAGYPKGFTLSLMAPNNRYVNDAKLAVITAQMLKLINIRCQVKTLPKAQYWPAFDEQKADIMMIGWHSDTEDSANFSEFLTMTRNAETGYGQYNNGNYSNAEVDRLTLASQTETDPEKRADLLRQVEKLLADDAAIIPLHWQNLAWAARADLDIKPILNVMNFPYFGDLKIAP